MTQNMTSFIVYFCRMTFSADSLPAA